MEKPNNRKTISPSEEAQLRAAAHARQDGSLDSTLLGAVSVQRVRKAHEQVYDQLRELIMSGAVARGERLPKEADLAQKFGVSRGTVREALRVLASQNLIRTAKGAGGGSFVTLPAVDHISEFLRLNISLLSESEDVTLEEFLEARELLEVRAAEFAAERRCTSDLEALHSTMHDDPLSLTPEERFVMNKNFHSAVVTASRNTLLKISAQPIYSILQANSDRSKMGQAFTVDVFSHHREILEAIEAGDRELTKEHMQKHLHFLRSSYEKSWRRPRAAHQSENHDSRPSPLD